jgi:oligopeptide transport system substrate-binding protein
MAVVIWGPRRSLLAIPRPAEDANVLRIAYTQFLLPDPQRWTYPIAPHNLFTLSLWEPLVECDPATGQPQPAAAESWAWSADRKVLTLKLRRDARWSNGDPVTAHDFVRGWLRVLHQRLELAQTLFALRNAEEYFRRQLTDPAKVGVRAVDDFTLELRLNRVRSTLVAELAEPVLAPLHEGSERVFEKNSFFADPATLLTNGPFQLQSADYDGFRLKACPYYHGHRDVRLAGVEFIRADSRLVAPLLLAAGVVDVVSPVPYGPSRDLPTDRRAKLMTELVLGVTVVDLNVERGPLRDLRVRKALALSLDRAGAIAKYDPEHMVPALSWVPSMPGREGRALLREDVDEARRLLADAGYPGGRGFPVLTMSLPASSRGDPFPPAWAERWFQALGIKTYLTYEYFPQRSQRAMSGDYDLFYSSLLATVPDAGDLLGSFNVSSEVSTMRWTDKEVVGLFSEADAKTGSGRLAVLDKIEQLAMAAVPSLPLMFERRQAIIAAEVQGWYADPLARQSPKRLWLDTAPVRNPNPDPRL